MKKKKLLQFISKYNLGNNVESVIWKIEDDEISTRYISDDSELLAEIIMKNVSDSIMVNGVEMNGEVANLGVYDTKQFIKLLNVGEGEDISFSLMRADRGKHDPAYALITIKDTSSKSETDFLLVETSVIRDAPSVNDLPTVDLKLNLDKTFRRDFISGKNALPDADTFTVITSTNEVKIVIGYEVVNTNRVTLFPIVKGDIKDIKNMNFSSMFLKEILTANSEVETATLNISEQGIAVVEFETEDFVAKYYLVAKQ